MQPLHRVLQHHLHISMQPLQCDLHPHVGEHQGRTDYARNDRSRTPHTEGTFHRRLKPLYTEKHKVSCSGFLPKRKPMQHSCSVTKGFAATRAHPCSHYNAICIHMLQNTKREPITPETIAPATATWLQPLYTENARFRAPASSPKQTPCNSHAAITLRFAATRAHPCSHYNAICIHMLQNTMGEPITRRNERTCNRRTHKVAFIAGCSHFIAKNTRFRAPASSQKHTPCNSHAAITMRFAPTHVTTSLSHHPSSSPFVITFRHHLASSPFVITLRHHSPPFLLTSLSHHPSVITLRHHPSSSPFVLTSPCYHPSTSTITSLYHHPSSDVYCCVMYCYVMYCSHFTTLGQMYCFAMLLLCDVLSLRCIVAWRIITASPLFVTCIVMWCKVIRI